jgi:hypothetical protein
MLGKREARERDIRPFLSTQKTHSLLNSYSLYHCTKPPLLKIGETNEVLLCTGHPVVFSDFPGLSISH